MNEKIIKNAGVSVRQQLLNLARQSERPFAEILQYYMIERFIYRLSKSIYKDKFILKGALMFTAWNLLGKRATRDIDFAAKTHNTLENITSIVEDICQIDCTEDAVIFITKNIKCESIQEQNEYHGIRVAFDGELATARTRMQIDIGFGDIIFPHPSQLEYPTLLNMPSPLILGYPPETVIAEKVHAMMLLGLRNSRLKDYFDIWYLSHQFRFNGSNLSEAINQTFFNRGMKISDLNLQIFDDIGNDGSKQQQWNSFINKNQLLESSKTFNDVMKQVKSFIYPVFDSVKRSELFKLFWQPPGPWR